MAIKSKGLSLSIYASLSDKNKKHLIDDFCEFLLHKPSLYDFELQLAEINQEINYFEKKYNLKSEDLFTFLNENCTMNYNEFYKLQKLLEERNDTLESIKKASVDFLR